jgi:hypothetical protein
MVSSRGAAIGLRAKTGRALARAPKTLMIRERMILAR